MKFARIKSMKMLLGICASIPLASGCCHLPEKICDLLGFLFLPLLCDPNQSAVAGEAEVWLIVNVQGQGHVLMNPPGNVYPLGTTVSLVPIADTGWHFVRWEQDLGGSDTPAQVAIDGHKTVRAVFERDYTPSLEGTWESADSGEPEEEWSDSKVAIVQLFQETGNPFASWLSGPEGLRSFGVFDANQVLIASYNYDPAENVLYLETPASNPFVGRTAEMQGDGSLRIERIAELDLGGVLSAACTLAVAVLPQEGQQTYEAALSLTVCVTATQYIPENPETGRPAILPGDTVTYTRRVPRQLTRSANPWDLFPDAEWRLGEESGDESPKPTGYYEAEGPVTSNSGWDDPNAPLAILLAGTGSLPQGLAGPGRRDFMLYDEGVLLYSYEYSEANDVVYRQGSDVNPLVGRMPSELPDGELQWVTEGEFESEVLRIALNADVRLADGSDTQGHPFHVYVLVTYTVLVDIEPSIPAGTQVSYVLDETYVLTRSDSPYVIFPAAGYEEAQQ